MDSKCFQPTNGNYLPPRPHEGSYVNNESESSNEVDLTLRLGFPQYNHLTHHQQNKNVHDTSKTQAANQYGIMDGWGSDMAIPCSNGLDHYSGSLVGNIPGYNDSCNFIPYSATPQVNNYAVEFEADSSSVSRRKYARRQRADDTGSFNIEKRCANPNCNTNDTPMWRKGPLGPKTLCNACGIKYRKDEERRRGNGVAEPSGHGLTASVDGSSMA